jgi:hypothetical protein
MSRRLRLGWLLLGSVLWIAACAPGQVGGVVEEGEATEFGDPEYGTFTNYNFEIGAEVQVCRTSVGLNNRSGPSTEYMVLRVLENGEQARINDRSGNWYRLDLNGEANGWSYGKYLCRMGEGHFEEPEQPEHPEQPGDPSAPSGFGVNRDGIINTAQAYVGYPFWWGHAKYPAPWDDPASKNQGSCNSGPYGADCSGYVAKVQQFPEALPYPENKHPFTTWSYYNQTVHWNHIARGNLQRADFMVYRDGNGGHSLVYEGGDPWGDAWVYESRGCSYGVVHNVRSLHSAYRACRRHGL